MKSYTLALLAETCIKNEHYREALDFLEQAQARLNDENCERFYAAEIYRLLGEAHLRLGNGGIKRNDGSKRVFSWLLNKNQGRLTEAALVHV